MSTHPVVEALARTLVLGSCLDEVRARFGAFELLDHWTQGEFHHDLVLRVASTSELPGNVLVVATNCNGGIKEVLCFDAVPERAALWSMRCPDNPDFRGAPPACPVAKSTTLHWFDPCELLTADARSELLPEHRERQEGGGWVQSRGCAKRSG